jgi:hypothetical protein
LHAAFIDFKQATLFLGMLYENIFGALVMPVPLLSIIQDMYDHDEYVLKDGNNTARVHPIGSYTWGKTGLSPFPLAIFPRYK